MSKDLCGGVAAICACLSMWFGGCTVGAELTGSSYREDAIKRGYAEYNATTGEWQWKEQGNED